MNLIFAYDTMRPFKSDDLIKLTKLGLKPLFGDIEPKEVHPHEPFTLCTWRVKVVVDSDKKVNFEDIKNALGFMHGAIGVRLMEVKN